MLYCYSYTHTHTHTHTLIHILYTLHCHTQSDHYTHTHTPYTCTGMFNYSGSFMMLMFSHGINLWGFCVIEETHGESGQGI